MYHVKGSSMKNFKRIAALAGVVILLLIFCLPMAFAWEAVKTPGFVPGLLRQQFWYRS